MTDTVGEKIMDPEMEREREQLRKLDKLRKLILTILRTHVWTIIIIFVLILAALLALVGICEVYSPTRYLARLTLCFHPKHQGKIGQYDDKYVLRILNRYSTREVFASQSDGQDLRRASVAEHIRIVTDRKQPHSFFIALSAGSEHEAVTCINEFAAVCIQEYARERTRDLRQWRELLDAEKKDLYEKIQKFSAEIAELTGPLRTPSPEKDHDRLQMRLNDLQSARSRLNYVLTNLTGRQKQLESALATVDPMLLAHRNEIRDFFRDMEHLDREVAVATELYTDENPKMLALSSRREAVRKRLEDFLKEKKIRSADARLLRLAETMSAELKSLLAELEARQNEKQVLDDEIADCTQRLQLFSDSQPRLQWLIRQRLNLQESMRRLDESIAEINYMQLMVKEDLFINEIAKSAVAGEPFSRRNLAVCIFSAVVLTAFCAALLTLIEFFFGVVADSRELMLYTEFHYLGALPASGEMLLSADSAEIAFNCLFHKFLEINPQVVLSGSLPGARIIPQFFKFLEWNFAMAGRRMLVMEMVRAEEYAEVLDCGGTGGGTTIVTFAGGKCLLPVSGKKFLIPSERELLKNDFKLLRERYDCIFIRPTFPLRRSKLFLEQIASLCDAVLYAVGAGRTPRKNLRELFSLQIRIRLPVMTILIDNTVKKLKKNLNWETGT